MNRQLCVLALCVGAISPASHAQTNYFDISVSNIVSPAQPSANIEVWTAWDPAMYAFAYAGFDLIASTDPGGFSNPKHELKGPNTYRGDVSPDGDSVVGIVSGQLQFDGGGGIFADTSNPILVFSVSWSTEDFTPRMVGLTSATTKYTLYLNFEGYSESFLDEFIEGNGVIQVVPSPGAGVALLGLPALLAHRLRRRSRLA